MRRRHVPRHSALNYDGQLTVQNGFITELKRICFFVTESTT